MFELKRDPIACRPAGAEPLEAFYSRVNAALDKVMEKHAGGHVLVVAHAGVIRMALCRVLGMPPENAYRILVASASLSRIKVAVREERRFESLIFWLRPLRVTRLHQIGLRRNFILDGCPSG